MSVETSTSGSAMGGGEATARERRIVARAEQAVHLVRRLLADFWKFFRFLPFALYLVAAILSFWLWMLWLVVGLLRFVVRGLLVTLLWLAGGIAPRPGPRGQALLAAIRRDLRYIWIDRIVALDALTRSIRSHAASTRHAVRTFMWWSIPRKGLALVFFVVFIGVPGLYVVPRPNLVQVVDNNAIQYSNAGRRVRYVIHAVDLRNPRQTQEYVNERVWWLGKIDPQGIKSVLQPGRYYRFWVVGIRWYYLPTLFPNIVGAQEVDPRGRTIPDPLLQKPVLPAPTGGG